MAISTNQKPTIYRNLYESTGPDLSSENLLLFAFGRQNIMSFLPQPVSRHIKTESTQHADIINKAVIGITERAIITQFVRGPLRLLFITDKKVLKCYKVLRRTARRRYRIQNIILSSKCKHKPVDIIGWCARI